MAVVAIGGRRLQMAAAAIGRQRWRRQCGRRRDRWTAAGAAADDGGREDSGGGWIYESDDVKGVGGHMGVISTNSHVCLHKLCSLCVRSQEFNSWGITTWAEGKKDEKNSSQRCVLQYRNLKGKPMTKTIGLHWLHGLQNTFPPQMKRAYTEQPRSYGSITHRRAVLPETVAVHRTDRPCIADAARVTAVAAASPP
jgi:hypothetical protein